MRNVLRITGLLTALMLPLAGCQRSANDGTEGDQASDETETVTAPTGTVLLVTLREPLSTETNSGGETFMAVLVEPVMAEGRAVMPAGSTIQGTVTEVQRPGEGSEIGRMVLTLDSAQSPQGERMDLETNTLELVAKPSTEDDLEKIAAGGVAGGIIGGVLGGGKGAVAGAVAGAGAGTIVAIVTQDKDVRLASGQKLQFSLVEPAEFELLAAAMGR